MGRQHLMDRGDEWPRDDAGLDKWLRVDAGLDNSIIEATVATLHEEEVFTVDDLLVLRHVAGGHLDDFFKLVTSTKISHALDEYVVGFDEPALSLAGAKVSPVGALLPPRPQESLNTSGGLPSAPLPSSTVAEGCHTARCASPNMDGATSPVGSRWDDDTPGVAAVQSLGDGASAPCIDFDSAGYRTSTTRPQTRPALPRVPLKRQPVAPPAAIERICDSSSTRRVQSQPRITVERRPASPSPGSPRHPSRLMSHDRDRLESLLHALAPHTTTGPTALRSPLGINLEEHLAVIWPRAYDYFATHDELGGGIVSRQTFLRSIHALRLVASRTQVDEVFNALLTACHGAAEGPNSADNHSARAGTVHFRDIGTALAPSAMRVEVRALRRALAGSLTSMKRALTDADASGDGVVDRSEFRAAVRMALNVPASDAACDALFDDYDADRSGVISYVELLRTFLRGALQGSLSRVVDLFKRLDTNGGGWIDRREFRQAIRAMGFDAPREEVDAIFDEVDADGSGKVSYRELHKLLRRGSTISLAPVLRPGGAGAPQEWGRSPNSSRSPSPESFRRGGASSNRPTGADVSAQLANDSPAVSCRRVEPPSVPRRPPHGS